MPRYIKNAVLLAKVETTPGTDATPTGSTDAVLLVGDVEITPIEASLIERNLSMPWLGASAALLGTYYSKITFTAEAAGSGTAGTAAPWGDLLLGCACAEASLTTPPRVEITPVSTGFKTLTLYFYDDGVLHKLVGAVGSAKLSAKIGEVPKLAFEYLGAYVPPTATANASATLTAWRVPPTINKANVTDITLGCTYATGALTGGTAISSTGLELDLGVKTSFFSTLSREGGEVNGRESKVSYELELTAAQTVTAMADMVANTTTSLGFVIGTAAGNKLMLHLPSIQRTSAKPGNREGIRMMSFEARVLPVAGNDEFRLVQL